MRQLVTVYAVFGSDDEAARIAREVVKEKLAACANILAPCRSIFEWEGELSDETETPVLFKATRDNAGALIAAIAERHSYDTPAICVWPIETVLDSYGTWVEGQVKPSG